MTITPELIASVATLIGVIGSVVVSIRNSGKLDVVHDLTNSVSKERLEETHKSAFAEGEKSAKEQFDKTELARLAAFESGQASEKAK